MPRVTQKGQVTIPKNIRTLLSINTGDEVAFELAAGEVVLRKNTATAQNLKKYVGYLSHLNGKDPDDIVVDLRGNTDDHHP
jgi:antitoxin PrlF